ncbi:hypothetical protein FQN54_001496 [Arachnomyces sp. PD_36]|nr:hypothetical protein FQN54_001496 [Arachnomyces sp. PD_36]
MDENQTKICVALSIPYFFAVLFTAARFVSRYIGKQRIWLDDYLIIPAFLGATSRVVIFALAFQLGLGRPEDEIDQIHRDRNEPFYALARLTFLNNFGWIETSGFAKLSLCALYWRLFQYSVRNGILITAGLTAVWTVVVTITMVLQCVPVESSWNPEVPGSCIDTVAANTWPLVTHFVIDILILVLPVVVISQMRKLQRVQRRTILLLFMFGVSICVLAIAMLALTIEWNQTDCYSADDKCLSYYLQVYRVSAAEPSLILISANVPTLTPLYHKLRGTSQRPPAAHRMEKGPLDRTMRKRKLDTLNGKISTNDTGHDSTRGLAPNESSCDIESSAQAESGRTGTARSESVLHERQEAPGL